MGGSEEPLHYKLLDYFFRLVGAGKSITVRKPM